MCSMRQPIFIICGYGIPQNMYKDVPYQTYLHIAFNTIFQSCRQEVAYIIPCGGPTNGEPPFEQTEAASIAEYLSSLIQKPELNNQADGWNIIEENQSLSSLENLVFAKHIIEEKKLDGPITIFCEHTRKNRLQKTANVIFGVEVNVVTIDFDVSKNRYLEQDIIEEKENQALKEALWTLEHPSRLEAHHKFFEAKFAWFREEQSKGRNTADIVEEWYTTKMHELARSIMPEHPILS